MSVAKPFVFALVCDAIGPDAATERIGANAAGLPFDSLEAVERSADGRTNPMMNPGAIAATSLVPGDSRKDLAVTGATLADGGVNPVTRGRFVRETLCHHVLAVMSIAGLYETSGDWLYDIGLPAKSGIGGGIVTVSPGKGGLGTFAPPLDAAGNSMKGQMAARLLSKRLGLDLFASAPPDSSRPTPQQRDGRR